MRALDIIVQERHARATLERLREGDIKALVDSRLFTIVDCTKRIDVQEGCLLRFVTALVPIPLPKPPDSAFNRVAFLMDVDRDRVPKIKLRNELLEEAAKLIEDNLDVGGAFKGFGEGYIMDFTRDRQYGYECGIVKRLKAAIELYRQENSEHQSSLINTSERLR